MIVKFICFNYYRFVLSYLFSCHVQSFLIRLDNKSIHIQVLICFIRKDVFFTKLCQNIIFSRTRLLLASLYTNLYIFKLFVYNKAIGRTFLYRCCSHITAFCLKCNIYRIRIIIVYRYIACFTVLPYGVIRAISTLYTFHCCIFYWL